MSHGIVGTESPEFGLEITDAPDEDMITFIDDAPSLSVRDKDGNVLLSISDGAVFQMAEKPTDIIFIETDGNVGIGSGGHDWPLVVDSRNLVRDGN